MDLEVQDTYLDDVYGHNVHFEAFKTDLRLPIYASPKGDNHFSDFKAHEVQLDWPSISDWAYASNFAVKLRFQI